MRDIYIIKIGGNIVNNDNILKSFLKDYANINKLKILIHGGGIIANNIIDKMQLKVHMINGRRITDNMTLKVVVMSYAGLINKNIVALLQSFNVNSIGLCGVDGNIITAIKRPIIDSIDYGNVGDISCINVNNIIKLLKNNFHPVLAPITHDKNGNLLNTNADTIASYIASSLIKYYNVYLYYCFERDGVLSVINDNNSIILNINKSNFNKLKNKKLIFDGMIPKIDNSFYALNKGVKRVYICNYTYFNNKKRQKCKTEITL